jgi:hypothetical protein
MNGIVVGWAISSLVLGAPVLDRRTHFVSQQECERVLELIKREEEVSGANKKLFPPPTRFCTNVIIQQASQK